jgi:hypothetical protein
MHGVSRRKFLRAAGASAALLIGPGLDPRFAGKGGARVQERAGVRIAVLLEPGFPGADDFGLGREVIASALREFTVDFLSASDLTAKLTGKSTAGGYDLLVNPHGSAFPVECWESIRTYLRKGGSLLHLGGAPFSVPVRRDGTLWKPEVFQASYYKELGITASFPVEIRAGMEIRGMDPAEPGVDPAAVAGGLAVSRVHALYVKFTSTRDYPLEDGTSGQRDAAIWPLAGAFTAAGDMIAAPVVVVDRLLGEYAGGRWVLAAYSGSISAGALEALARAALPEPLTAAIVPTFATYYPGETPAFRLVTRRAKSGLPADGGSWRITVTGRNGKVVHRETVTGGDLIEANATARVLPSSAARNLRPGFYAIEGIFTPGAHDDPASGTLAAANGFWIYDEEAIRSAKGVEVRGNSFYRDGKPFPVAGTSYMSEGVQRKFLFEPNPRLWEEDFRAMREAGVNLVRTGVWTGWKNIMLDVGSVNEYSLRSLDAFVLSALSHDIPVIFTFFAFLPESWGGANPYMDPRSVQAQNAFVSAIAGRYRNAPGVIWDLINEPSFSSPDQLWLCRPNYDRFEAAEWTAWSAAQSGAADSAAAEGILRERYRLTAGESPGLPPLPEFREANLAGAHRPLRAGDYRLFAQEMFRRWTAGLVSLLKTGTGQLVTVGQDEGGTYERPGPHFFGPEVDFTSMHNWWYNDDLLWDSLMTAVPGKPNLIEETGVMTYERADGRPWRTEQETRDLLERKLAIAFASGSAGFVHWLWNTNEYMDSDNEPGIGLRRPDGSLKPEFDVMRQYARFFTARAELMGERAEEDAVLVIPHSNMFSTRNSATEATKNAVRALEYRCRIPVRTVSEYALPGPGTPQAPRLLIFPSPGVIDREAWTKLSALVSAGSTLLVTGPIDDDRFLIPAGRSAALGVDGETVPVGAEEHLTIDGREYRLGYRGDRMQRLRKFVPGGTSKPELLALERGSGRVIWAPHPVELSDSMEAMEALYRFASARAGLTRAVEFETGDPSVLARPVLFRDSIMLVFVSEAAGRRSVAGTLIESGSPFSVEVPARRSVVNFHDRKSGKVIATLNPSLSDAI